MVSRNSVAVRSRQAGLSLIEVMVALVVLAVGVLGVAALQTMTLRNNQSASARTMATIQGYAMLDMLRANRDVAVAGAYNQGFLCAQPDEPDAGSPQAGRVNSDVSGWISQMQGAMGATACGSIACGPNACTVNVRWNDERASGAAAAEMQIVTIRTRI